MRFFLVAVSTLVAAMASGSGQPQPADDDVGSIMVAFGAHLDDHPHAGADDLYKFLHQAVYGSGHAIPSRQAAAGYLERELDSLGPPLEGEAPCEELGGEPALVRVNLRPFVANNGSPDLLLDAFVASANVERGKTQRMQFVLKLASSYLKCAGRPDLSQELEALAGELADNGFPAIHHSENYREVYQPAYRVVAAKTAEAHDWCEGSLQ